MPTYDYKCPQCGNLFEQFHAMSETPAIECPTCAAIAEKQIGMGAGVQFKGNGFYVNDYKPSGGEAPAGSCAGGTCGCGH